MSAQIRRLSSVEPGFVATLDALLAFEGSTDAAIEQAVADILQTVRKEGDAAVVEYTRRFDHLDVADMAALELPKSELGAALAGLSAEQRTALEAAAARVRSYHERQVSESWRYSDDSPGMEGTRLGQKVTPLDRVGLYVPGGRASYPSSVLMNALPAKVAGVPRVVMVVPATGGAINPTVLAAASIAGVTEMTSYSSMGSSRVTLQFDLSRDADSAARDVAAGINAARNLLPTGMPSNPTSAKTFSSNFRERRSPGQPGVFWRGARLVELL